MSVWLLINAKKWPLKPLIVVKKVNIYKSFCKILVVKKNVLAAMTPAWEISQSFSITKQSNKKLLRTCEQRKEHTRDRESSVWWR